jgi:hypothetical protein
MLNSLMGCDLGNRRERDETNITNDDVFRSVCSVYLRPMRRLIGHEKMQDLYQRFVDWEKRY